MENASKALLIAGGFLLMILLLSLMTFIFSNIAQESSGIYDKLSESDKTDYNQQFLQFEDRGKTKISEEIYDWLSVQEVATILNFAIEQNNNPKVPVTVSVILKENAKQVEITNNNDVNVYELLTKYRETKFKCESIERNDDNLVNKITLLMIN